MASARLQISLLLNGDEFLARRIINSYNSSTIVSSVSIGMDPDQATVDFMLNNFNDLTLTQSEKIQLLKLLNENYIDTLTGDVPLGNQELAQAPFGLTTADLADDIDNTPFNALFNNINRDGRFIPEFPLRPPLDAASSTRSRSRLSMNDREDSMLSRPVREQENTTLNVVGQFRMNDEEGTPILYNFGDVVYYEGNSYVCQVSRIGGWVPETAHSGNPWKQIDLPDNNIDGGAEF